MASPYWFMPPPGVMDRDPGFTDADEDSAKRPREVLALWHIARRNIILDIAIDKCISRWYALGHQGFVNCGAFGKHLPHVGTFGSRSAAR
jgi:hypothetical protein